MYNCRHTPLIFFCIVRYLLLTGVTYTLTCASVMLFENSRDERKPTNNGSIIIWVYPIFLLSSSLCCSIHDQYVLAKKRFVDAAILFLLLVFPKHARNEYRFPSWWCIEWSQWMKNAQPELWCHCFLCQNSRVGLMRFLSATGEHVVPTHFELKEEE